MDAWRRIAVVLTGLALLAAGCGGDKPAPPPARADLVGGSAPWQTHALDRVARARAMALEEARRRAELARLERSVTVRAALRRALLSEAIGRREYRGYRVALAGARKAARRLTGARRVEQSAVLASIEQLAAERRLTPSRLPAVFLNLRRNTRTWTQDAFPSAGERRSFAGEPEVFQYVPGRGMQLHPLASWGRVNWRLRRCLEARGGRASRRVSTGVDDEGSSGTATDGRASRRVTSGGASPDAATRGGSASRRATSGGASPDAASRGGSASRREMARGPCAERRLKRRLDALARLPARRGGFVAWEYYYAYAQGTPPWMSGMAQATAIQALSRAAVLLRAPRYARLARRALGAFETAPPTGVSVPVTGGRRYVMYSFAPTLQIINGELQAVNGLRDAAVLGRSRRAARLVASGDRAARAALGGFDTGAWSLYSSAGGESTLAYHQLTTAILAELCRRTERAEYCRAERRFARYETEPPRIGIAPLRGLWARRSAPLHFTLSKGSAVRVRVYGPRGVILARDVQLGRGGHDFSWTPPSRGRFRVRVSARGPEGRLGSSGRTVRIVRPKPKPKPEAPRAKRPERVGEVEPSVGGGVGEGAHRGRGPEPSGATAEAPQSASA